MKPIASKFLKSGGLYKPVSGTDDYGTPSYGTSVSISRIYVEYPKRNSLTDLGEQAADRLLIFHDVQRSSPREHVYKKGDVFTYGSEDFTVREAQLLPNPDQPHHWEVRLT